MVVFRRWLWFVRLLSLSAHVLHLRTIYKASTPWTGWHETRHDGKALLRREEMNNGVYEGNEECKRERERHKQFEEAARKHKPIPVKKTGSLQPASLFEQVITDTLKTKHVT
ncbi:hypothetical protein YC2023_060840 [Brassica napus]